MRQKRKICRGPYKEICEYVVKTTKLLHTKGWHHTCLEMRGERSDITAKVVQLAHQAAPYLDRIDKNGAPIVLQSSPWDAQTIKEQVMRGPHRLVSNVLGSIFWIFYLRDIGC
jgi:hypothetical protein